MAVSVTLPALGESVTEGTVTRWLKAEGERVEADEPVTRLAEEFGTPAYFLDEADFRARCRAWTDA
ncbi:biotin/lipoyl-containing protein, partial [Streptomyces niveus]|uniref:biotin/lipoyl-containing protein n=1 Tax=Streptomyces niveus TaxID=193462 RepID=UPI0034144CDF